MGQFVEPRTFLLGYTTVNIEGLDSYLKATNQEDFSGDYNDAVAENLSSGEALCSFYAKLCYKSLRVGKNANITKIRSIKENLKATFNQAHGSVFEHAMVNFVTTDCSRVFTHELVRMRAGWAYSQTSGRYCRLDSIDFVHDPILGGCEKEIKELLQSTEQTVYVLECRKGLRKPNPKFPTATYLDCFVHGSEHLKWIPDESGDMNYKKAVTSAIRRIAPNGQANEIGFSVNFRALRHFVMLRSTRFAEWEIRLVANQVYDLLNNKFPMLFYGVKQRVVKGLREFYGMRMQPYEMHPDDPEAIKMFTLDQLTTELDRRNDGK
jgi:thymidylate synthase (FAD)